METIEEFRQQVFDTRDRYYKDMMKTFLGFYQGGILLEISILFQPGESYELELATDKFKKAIGELSYKVIKIVDDDNDRRFTIRRMDYDVKIKQSKCIIS